METDKAKSWFSIKTAQPDPNGGAEFAPPEVMLYDEIGSYGITAADFDRDLKSLGDTKQINLRINSPGGDSFAGVAIYNTLKKHPATITAHIDGIAASAASLIAMAADKIVMPKNAFMVVHEASALTYGPADQHLAMAADLERVSSSYANTYSARSKQTLENVKALMKEDRLMGAEECKAKGYCDDLTDPMTVTSTFELSKLPEKFRSIAASLYTPDDDEAAKSAAKESERVDEIRALGTKARMPEAEIEAAITSGTSKKEFRKVLLARLLDEKAAISPEAEASAAIEAAKRKTADDAAAAYGLTEIQETVDLCIVAKVPLAKAQEFITAKMPVAKVSEALVAIAAAAADSRGIVPVATVGSNGGESDAEIVARKRKINEELRAEAKGGKKIKAA